MIQNCELKENTCLPYLDRAEGGIGGANNSIHKQIRFRRHKYKYIPKSGEDNDIYLDQICNTDIEQWTYPELDDLVRAFVKTASQHVGAQCVDGFIEITPDEPEE